MTTGLFLGAGASFELGMPLVWDLTAELLAWLTPDKLRTFNRGWRIQGGGYSDTAIEDVERILATKGMHYESMLGHLQIQFKRHSPYQQDFHGLYAWLVEAVYLLLYYRHTKNVEFITSGMRYLEGIVGLARANTPLWIFSLNHDLLIECLCAHYGVTLNCGFEELGHLPRRDPSGKKIGELQTESLSGNSLEKSGMRFAPPGTPSINLLKLHGSLDTFMCREGKDLMRILPSGDGVGGVIAALKSANEELLYIEDGFRPKTTNEINYADEEGIMQFLRRTLLAGAHKFDSRFTQVLPTLLMHQFRSHILSVKTLICLGYGFGDTHINDVMRDWLEFTSERRIQIVAPGLKDVPSFLHHLRPQVSLHDTRASDFLETFSMSPLTLAERGLKQIRAVAREGQRKQRGFA